MSSFQLPPRIPQRESYRPKTGFPAISNSREFTTASGPHEGTAHNALCDGEESSNPAGSKDPGNSACEFSLIIVTSSSH